MKITVCTPTHIGRLTNGMFAQAMQSVAQQTYPAAATSVCVDVNREGAAPTRHKALMGVRTEWVAFLDSDDLFLPRHLELMAKHVQDTEADFCYSWFRVLTKDGNIIDDPIFPLTHYTNDWDPENPIETTITTLVRTELAQEVGFFALDRGHDINSGEDRRFTIECMNLGAKISHLKRRTWLYRHHGENTSGLPTKGDAA